MTENQTSVSGGAAASLNANKTYSITVVDGSEVHGLDFGNLCLGAGGGLTLGFGSNRNGQALFTAADLAMLNGLHLRNALGANVDPGNYTTFRSWLLSATAVNIAYMLSAQLAAMELNVAHARVSGGALIHAPGTTSANPNGFATVNAVMDEAETSLTANGLNANNNKNFVQPGPSSCPAPVFEPNTLNRRTYPIGTVPEMNRVIRQRPDSAEEPFSPRCSHRRRGIVSSSASPDSIGFDNLDTKLQNRQIRHS